MKRLLWLPTGLVLLGIAWTLSDLYRAYQAYPEKALVKVEAGSRAPDVAELLVSHGVLEHRLPFLVRYMLGRPRHRLKAGEYLFDKPLRPIDVYWKLVRGEVHLRTLVVPEGSDLFDIAGLCREQLGISPEEFLQVARQGSAVHDLDTQAETLEGYLFPDTYRFPYGTPATVVVATMLARFRQVLESKFPAELRASPHRLHEVVTLASLVEKETPEAAERPVVAGVFLKRLEKRWPLQCDPTVVYAARLRGRFVESISQADLTVPSPYNTYRVQGLPPGPICSPGESSLQAALHPASIDFLYFVSNNQGGHLFAKTLAEHQRNVARYRKHVATPSRLSPEVKHDAP